MNNELTHWGIKGMRWGVRRFQNKDGSLTAAGKKRLAEGTEESKEDYEARKHKAVTSGSAKEVLEFKGDLSPQEMRSAIERIRWEQDMKTISDKDAAAGKEKVDRFFKDVDKATEYTVIASKAYNTFANIYNAFTGTDKAQLPTIQTNNTVANRGVRKAEAEKRKEAADKKEAAKKEAETNNAKSEEKVRASKVKVSGEGTSKGKKETERVVYDVDWTDDTPSRASDSYRADGQRYIAGLLEEKNK